MEREGGRVAGGVGGRLGVDGRIRGRRVHRPGEAGRGAGVADLIGCPHVEAVAALDQRVVGGRAGAAAVAAAVQLALCRARGLRGVEGEGRRGLVGRVVGHRVEEDARRGRVDGPGECRGSRVGVAGGVGGGDCEGVAARGESAVGGRAGAGGGSHAVEAAQEGRAGFCGMEGEGGRGAAGRACRAAVDDRVGRRRVDGPGVTGRQAGVAHRVGGYDCEGVAALGKRPGVALRARAGDIAARVQLHWKLTPPSVSEKLKEAEVWLVGLEGLLVIDGADGATVSTTHAEVAAVASVLPAASVALTAKVWLPSVRLL